LLVVGQHIALLTYRTCPPRDAPAGCSVLSQGFTHGFVGVACFFVISGFVLAWSVTPGESAPRFWRRRLAKIYPLLLLSNVTDLVITVINGEELPSATAMIANLFVVQSWVPGSEIAFRMNPVTWSLSCELAFYLLFPFIFSWLHRLSIRVLRMLVVGAVFWPGLVYAVAQLVAPAAMNTDPGAAWRTLYFWPGTRISEFVIGMAAALLLQRGAWRGFPVIVAITLAVAGYVACVPLIPLIPGNEPVLGLLLVPVYAVLIVSLANADITGSWSPLRSGRMVLLGTISYALYLFHPFIVNGIGPVLGWDNSWQILSNVVTIMALCTIVSWALYRMVEKPGQKLLNPRPSAGMPKRPARS
jgi:peptidoglycan/LPS O-acetylase OafA/YrhL